MSERMEERIDERMEERIDDRMAERMEHREEMREPRVTLKKAALSAILVMIACFSFAIAAERMSSPALHQNTIQSIDGKIKNVMELTAAATSVSIAVTALPDDMATPVAEKLADFSGYFLIVLCALFLEKYMVTVTGYASFAILFPLACAFLIASLYFRPEGFRQTAKKLAIFGLAVYLLVPMSIRVADIIDATYQTNIDSTIEMANDTAAEIEESTEAEEEKADPNVIQGLVSTIGNLVSDAASSAAGLVDKAQVTLNRFLEALAVMIVTSCIIPILVMVFLLWLVKIFLGVDIPARYRRF